ncbi:hypothetical protein AOQ84DRAFT_11334 [Glonium stellatum]|uniref:Uncharacterized protein n=1 Tax=Glonium stellatum TaxID=574774 RepID=A0A8E2F3H5_9PEZI|nr:hypothetical protein AOQ84DRAFT_11334 [Glonium stellatum]
MGDRFHIDPCKDRHEVCVPAAPVPDWMMAPWEKSNKPNTHLDRILNLHVTRVCQQVYHETKLLPFALNTFVFRHATAFLRFFLCLRAFQAQAVKEVCIFMTAGQRHDDHTLTSRWNNALFVSPLIDRLKGLRILHISITISHTGIGDNGPVRSELADPVQLDSWVIGLQRLRGLPLRDATVIVSDDPNSKFGIEGYSDKFLQYGWNGTHQTWLTLRERECFTAEEKRRWAERIKSMLLKKPVNPP